MFNTDKVGEQIASLRKQKGLMQEDLAERLQVTPQAISKWENGHTMPEISQLPKLAMIFDCTIDSILMPDLYRKGHSKYIHSLLPYQGVDPYTGAGWPHSMAFPALMAALKLYMGLEERRNFNGHQINDDQEYILQSGLSTLAFGFSHYNAEFIHDCFQVYGLDYAFININGKPIEEIAGLVRAQINKGFPSIIQDKSHNATFLFITGITSDGKIIRANDFMEGADENNYSFDLNNLKTIDNWLKPEMELLMLYNIENKISIEKACKNALNNYCLMMSGKWDKEEFCSNESAEGGIPKMFMGYGSAGLNAYRDYLRRDDATIMGFYPQQAIFHESSLRTLGFLKMCKEYINNIDKQSINAAIDRYQVLLDNAWEIINISWHDKTRTEPEKEKVQEMGSIMTRSIEVFLDAVSNVKKAINFKL